MSEDLGVSCGFQGGRKGRDKLSLTECKGGDHRNLTAGEWGGVVRILQSLGGGKQVNLNLISPTVSPPKENPNVTLTHKTIYTLNTSETRNIKTLLNSLANSE